MVKQLLATFFGSMNKDVNPSFMKEGDYVDARNMRIGFTEGGNVMCAENIKGTLEIRNNSFTDTTGRYKCIGAATFAPAGDVYYFLKDTIGKEHMICVFSLLTKTISLLLKGDLGFGKRIITAKYFKDMLIWNDGEKDLRCINVSLAKSGYQFSDFATSTLIKFPPAAPIVAEAVDLPGTKGLVGPNQYQFIYRYVFAGNMKSVWSIPSFVCVVPSGDYNYVRLHMNSKEVLLCDQYSKLIQYIEIGVMDDSTQPFRFVARIPFPSVKSADFFYDFYNNAQLPAIPDLETTTNVYSDVPKRCSDFDIGDNRILTGGNTYGFDEVFGITATNFETSYTSTLDNGVYFLQGGQYYVGVVLYDRYDRRSAVYPIDGFKVRPRNGSVQGIKINITLTGQLPEWVAYWRPVVTRCANKGDFIQAHIDVDIANGTELRFKPAFISPTPKDYAWVFATGDKFSLLTADNLGNSFGSDMHNLPLEYDTTNGQYVVKGDFTGVADGALVEIYSPIKGALLDFYYEIGLTFEVYTSPNGKRYFGSNAGGTGQNFTITGGDTIYSLSQDAQIRNIDPVKFDSWYRNNGRRNTVSQDTQMEIENTSEIAFSDPFVQGTKLNGLNSFQFSSKKTFGAEFGDIKKLSIARDFQINGSVLHVVTQSNCYSVYLGKTQVKSTDGSSQISVTDAILGSANLLAGEMGTINPESVHVFGTTVRGWDAIRGVLWRYSNDGLTNLSMEYGMNSELSNLASSIDGTRGSENQTAVACYDPYFEEYLLCVKDLSKAESPTLGFNEKKNGFSSYYDFDPDHMCTVNRMVVSWKNGVLYLHRANDQYNILHGKEVASSVTVPMKQTPFDTINAHSVWAYAQDKWELEVKGIERTYRDQQITVSKLKDVDHQEDKETVAVKVDAKGNHLKSRYFLVKLTLDPSVKHRTVLYGVALPQSESQQNPV